MTAVNIPDLPHRHSGGNAPDDVCGSKGDGQFLGARARVEGEADCGEGDRDEHRAPRRNTRNGGNHGAMLGRYR